MGRGSRARRERRRRKAAGAWRTVLEENPLTPDGRALNTIKDEFTARMVAEAQFAKAKDWWARRGVRHP